MVGVNVKFVLEDGTDKLTALSFDAKERLLDKDPAALHSVPSVSQCVVNFNAA